MSDLRIFITSWGAVIIATLVWTLTRKVMLTEPLLASSYGFTHDLSMISNAGVK